MPSQDIVGCPLKKTPINLLVGGFQMKKKIIFPLLFFCAQIEPIVFIFQQKFKKNTKKKKHELRIFIICGICFVKKKL